MAMRMKSEGQLNPDPSGVSRFVTSLLISIRVSHFAPKFTNHLVHLGIHLYTQKNEIPQK